MIKRAWVFLAFYALTACGSPLAAEPTMVPTPTCQEQAAPSLAQIQSAAREWDDANALASQTPRTALAQQIESLQSVRRKVEDIAVPDCAAAVKTALVDSMEATIAGFIAFLGQKPDTEVNAAFTLAGDKMRAFGDAVQVLNGIPLPTPTPAPTPTVSLPTRDVASNPVTMEYHERLSLHGAPDGVVNRSLGNPGTITFLGQATVGGALWYQVMIGIESGWIRQSELSTDLDAEVKRVLPVVVP